MSFAISAVALLSAALVLMHPTGGGGRVPFECGGVRARVVRVYIQLRTVPGFARREPSRSLATPVSAVRSDRRRQGFVQRVQNLARPEFPASWSTGPVGGFTDLEAKDAFGTIVRGRRLRDGAHDPSEWCEEQDYFSNHGFAQEAAKGSCRRAFSPAGTLRV